MTLQEYIAGEKDHPWFCQGVDGEREPMCLPQLPCVRQTPYGEVEGLKCVLGSEINTNTSWETFGKVIESGAFLPSARQWVLGQDSISLSSCPPQTYGGTVKFVFDSDKLLNQLRAMCYVDFRSDWDGEKMVYRVPAQGDVYRGMEKEANELIPGTDQIKGTNRVRANYGINLTIYKEECEYVTYDPIPLKDNLKRIEYWIAARFTPHEASFDCHRGLGPYANIHGEQMDYLVNRVKEAKKAAEDLGAEFKVKSCFPLMKTGWGEYIELTDENLDRIASGELGSRASLQEESEYIDTKILYDKDRYKCTC